MKAPMRIQFNGFIESWMKRRYLGLPLRMILLCEWHRIHSGIIIGGLLICLIGKVLGYRPLAVGGFLIAAPSVFCWCLFPAIAIVFLLIEKALRD
jgi:hypothetical protein